MDEFAEVPYTGRFKAIVVESGRVLSPSVQMAVDEIWDKEFQLRQGKLVNGHVLGIVSISTDEILVEIVEYKIVLAQVRNPQLLEAINFKPLGTSGMTLSGGKVLLGQRSAYVSTYPNCYEMVPSGSIDCAQGRFDIDLKEQLINELAEEAGIASPFIEKCTGWTLIFDATTKVYEVVARIYVQPFLSSSPLQNNMEGEYRSLIWLGAEEFEKHLIQHSDHYVPMTKYLFTKWRDFMLKPE